MPLLSTRYLAPLLRCLVAVTIYCCMPSDYQYDIKKT